MRCVRVIVLLAVGALHVFAARAQPLPPRASSAAVPSVEPDALTFWTYDHDAAGLIVEQANVQARLLRCDGEQDLGASNATGHLRVPYSTLFAEGGIAVLFCAPFETTACTALRLDRLRGFAELNVRVTPPEIIDVFTVDVQPRRPRPRWWR